MAAGMADAPTCSHAVFVLTHAIIFSILPPPPAESVVSLRLQYPDEGNYSFVNLTCTRDESTIPDQAEFLKDGGSITTSGVSVVAAGHDFVAFTFTPEQDGFFSCERDGNTSLRIGLAATPIFGNETVYHYVVLPSLNGSRDIHLSCGIPPGSLQERYHFEWVEVGDSLDEETTINVTRNISSPTQFQCRARVDHSSEFAALYHGPVHDIQTIVLGGGSDIGNVIIDEGYKTNFTCMFGGWDGFSVLVFWTVGNNRYNCVTTEDEIPPDTNGCFTTGSESVLLINDLSPGDYLVQCHKEFVFEPSSSIIVIHGDIVIESGNLIVKLNLLLSVTYPKRGNYSFIFLSCLHRRKPKKGAQFLKDNRFIHVGTRETDVTSYTPSDDGTALISFTQAQEGNFSCYKGQCKYCFSENVALAASPPQTLESEEHYVIFKTPHAVRTVNLSCPIRPGRLRERYKVRWRHLLPVPEPLTNSGYNTSVDVDSFNASLRYQCVVNIRHYYEGIDHEAPPAIIQKNGISCMSTCSFGSAQCSWCVVYGPGAMAAIFLTTTCDMIENATVYKETEETVSLICAIVIGDSQPTIYWIFDGKSYDCGSSKNNVVNGRGCYTSDKATHFVILDTGPLAIGEYSVQCVIEQNIPPQFVNDVDFEETLNCTRLNTSVTLLELPETENDVMLGVIIAASVGVGIIMTFILSIAIFVSRINRRCRNTVNQEPDPNGPPTRQPSASNSGSEKLAAKNAGSIQSASGAEGQSPAATGQSKPEGGRRLSPSRPEPPPSASRGKPPTSQDNHACEKLQKVVSDRDIVAIARDLISDWEALATYLGMNGVQKESIRDSSPSNVEVQKRTLLQIWKRMNGKKATYQVLISAAEEAKNQFLADGVKNQFVIGMCSRANSSVVLIITVWVVVMAATPTATQGNNSTNDGNNDSSDGLLNGNIIAIVSVLVGFLSVLATVVGIIVGIKCYKHKTCCRNTQREDKQPANTLEECDRGQLLTDAPDDTTTFGKAAY